MLQRQRSVTGSTDKPDLDGTGEAYSEAFCQVVLGAGRCSMSRYQPDTDTGIAVRALVDEMLSTVRLPGMLSAALPLVYRELDKMIAGIDADPDAARDRLRPLFVRVVRALGFSAADLDDAA